ncbi:hypothetical protein FO131_19650 [Salmonella bongori]|uniref:putative antirestriction adenine methyltransferase n=1 Tax=Salmonella bongori TaxID=54736 RepID=UPI001286487C|nr:hypothetical protein [Salmonella bongori]ECG8260392.1 hypothetical protein [Salmonella bongori serovar 48:i:-]ECG9254722.1 hypothetical protein [Salmonella bongori]EDP8708188.1 hypothetical protein [Salmonella bongori]EDP8725808.1 hypothetical protein [Salmonella bongori]EEO9371564.1 hypothetical protein [Salmonella bongori]
MFIGSIPKKLITQILANIHLKPRVYIGCSGSFRTEHAIKNLMPEKQVFGNDVSLLSCAVGNLLIGERLDVEFSGRLDPLNLLRSDAVANTSAICLAITLARFKGNNQYSRAHFAHIMRNLGAYHRAEREKLLRYTDGFAIDGFYAGDFHRQIEAARENDGTVIMFAPTYKGGYENIYKFVNENTKWDAPSYGIWDPENIDTLVQDLLEKDQHFAIVSDRRLACMEPRIMFAGSNKPIYMYAKDARSSLRREPKKSQQFRYRLMDTDAITETSKVDIALLNAQQLNYLKNIYLAKGINHKAGMLNFAVLVDGMLAGAFIFSMAQYGDKIHNIYMLSDFSTSRHRKLSKLIPMLATSRSVINHVNRKYLIDIQSVYTTAFTVKPVSMKYRGIYQLVKRGEGFLNYASAVREQSPQQIFNEWYRKYAH